MLRRGVLVLDRRLDSSVHHAPRHERASAWSKREVATERAGERALRHPGGPNVEACHCPHLSALGTRGTIAVRTILAGTDRGAGRSH